MLGLEVIGGISAIITLLDALIKIYDGAQNDMRLPETFLASRRQLPIIHDILQRCKNEIEPHRDSMSSDAGEALEKILDACDEKAQKLRQIFERVLPGDGETWRKRYAKLIRRLGQGNKVEDLMIALTQDVQLIVNSCVISSTSERREKYSQLASLIEEMKLFRGSTSDDERNSALVFNSGGGAQTNNVNKGSGQQINNNAEVGAQYFNSVTFRQKTDFSFRKPAGICLGQAPHVAPNLFVGRKSELGEIEKALRSDQNQTRTQQRLLLSGIGGIGKTQLALAYAESPHQPSYSSVFWFDAASEAAMKDSFVSIANLIFDFQEPEALKDKEIVSRVHQWLSNARNTGWLLIFDNYNDPDQFRIDPYFPPASHGEIIITTRRRDLVAGSTVEVGPFQNIVDSLAILQSRSKRQDTLFDPYAKRLAERLAGLPLALATAGIYLQRSTFTFERYLQEYEKRWNIDPRRPTRLQEYEELTLYTTWDLSYARLKKDDPDAAKLLGLLAYFGNKTLWYGLLHTGPTGVSSTPDWMHEIIENDITFDGVMRTLTEYYFLEVHPLLQSWSMHNCVHDWTLATLNKNINSQSYWYAFDCVDRSMTQVGEDFLGNVSYSRLAVHASRLVHPRFLQSDLLSAMSPSRLEVAQRIAQLLKDQVQLAAAEQMYVRVLAGCEKTLGSDHASTLRIMNDFGNLYMDQGRLGDSETMHLRALARKEKTLGKKHPSTLDTAHNLGDVYREQDRLDDAEKMYNLALAGSEEALGADHPSTLLTVHNIAILYRSQGKLDDAERMYMRVLVGAEKAGEADHVSTLLTVNNLGNVYSDQGKLEEAEKMYLRALRGYEKALGANHTSTLLVVHNMGDLYCAQGKLDYAVQMYRKAVEGRERVLGNNHASTLLSVKHLGGVYRKQGCLVEAEQMLTRAALREERISQAQGQGRRI